MAKINVKNWAIIGAASSALTPLFLKVLSMIPTFQVTFSTLAIDLRSKIIGVSGVNFSNFLLGLTGQDVTLPAIIMSILGGALLVVGARYLLEYLPFNLKNSFQKLLAVFLIAAFAQLFIGSGFVIPAIMVLFGFLVNGIVMAYLMNWATKQFGITVA
jgi:hypothetical protein